MVGRLLAALIVVGTLPLAGTPVAAQPLPGTTCSLFPTDNILNADISGLPVNSQSATWVGNMTQNTNLHPDLGTFGQWYGMPINIAPPPSSGVTPTFGYNSESDHPAEGYPIDQATLIEGDLDVALRGKVVNLLRPHGLDQSVEAARVRHVAVMEDELRTLRVRGVRVLEVVDPASIHGRRAAHHPVHLVALGQQELGKIRAVLPSDSRDQRGLSHCRGEVSNIGAH